MKKPVPLLQGEIIRLQRNSELVDSDSGSEIDIDGSDDESKQAKSASLSSRIENNESKLHTLSGDLPTIIEAKPEDVKFRIQEHEPSLIEPAIKYVHDDKSEYESSETDTKNVDSEPPQPVFTFPSPSEERAIDLTTITNEEKIVHWDFFEGRPSKTPERYMKIRNSIINEWRRVKPRYLTKTSVRPSLKNCGDVNCISRVHAYLELTGAINFGCGNTDLFSYQRSSSHTRLFSLEQVQYNRPLPPVPSHRERMANSGTHLANHVSLATGLPARVRKKRAHPENGDENGGYTISHDGSQDSTSSTGSISTKPKQKRKPKAQSEDASNPFQLVPCINFGNEKMVIYLNKTSLLR